MIAEEFKKVLDKLSQQAEDAVKADTGNAAAGRRLRKACMEAIHELKALRASILERLKK